MLTSLFFTYQNIRMNLLKLPAAPYKRDGEYACFCGSENNIINLLLQPLLLSAMNIICFYHEVHEEYEQHKINGEKYGYQSGTS